MNPNMTLNNLMKEAEKMQKKMQEAQKELTSLSVVGKAGGDMVKVEMNGRHEAKKVMIKPAALEEEADILGELIAAAINDAVRQIERESQSKIGALTAGINIPNVMSDDKDDSAKG